MKNYQKFLMGMFGVALVFGMMFTGCGDGAGGGNNPPPEHPKILPMKAVLGVIPTGWLLPKTLPGLPMRHWPAIPMN